MFYIHFSRNLKTLAITFVNDNNKDNDNGNAFKMLMLLSNKILFIGCYFVTFTSVVHCHILCVFLLSNFLHVRMP